MARKIKAEDLYDLRFVSAPRLSPDGARAACVVTDIVRGSAVAGSAGPGNSAAGGAGTKRPASEGAAKEAGATPPYEPPRYRSRIHLFDLPARGASVADAGAAGAEGTSGAAATGARARAWPKVAGSGGVEFTRGEFADVAPRFSPDGTKLAFLAVRAEKARPQLHVMPLTGGEPAKITDLPAGVGAYAWLPDSKSLAFVSLGTWTDVVGERGLPRRIVRQRHRGDGEGFLPDAAADVYLVSAAGGEPQKLTSNHESAQSLSVSPDGKTLYFTRAKDVDDDTVFKADIVALDVASRTQRVIAGSLTGVNGLSPSPDGATLAFLASSRQSHVESPTGAWLVDLAPGRVANAPRLISGDLDLGPAVAGDSRRGSYDVSPRWVTEQWATGEGDPALLVTVHAQGGSAAGVLGLDGTVQMLQGPDTAVLAFSAARAAPGRMLFVAESRTHPGELFLKDGPGREVRLSGVNDAWCKALTLVEPEGPFSLKPTRASRAKGADVVPGRELVQYWTMTPSRPRADKASVVQVHGGPHTAYGYGFVFEFQLLASSGYGVIFGNPRGSSSYGPEFAASVLGRYGTMDAEDVMAIAEEGNARLGGASAPLHLTGGSYGGFMTNWLVGQTKRFRSAVSQRSISNWTSMYGSSDIGPVFVEREIGGNPWADLDVLWKQSPIRHVAAVRTPLLLIHSENDFRCPIDQAEQFYTAIKRLGTSETELLRVPDEGHELSRSGRPDRRVARLEAIVEWFERHP
jgi:acylaminoacyl-peptidase